MSHPDAQIHPVATGRAAETVAQHQHALPLTFYAGWVRSIISHRNLSYRSQFCPFVQRAWIVLEEKGIPYQYREVNPYKKEKHFLGTVSDTIPLSHTVQCDAHLSVDINPRGLVPAVEYNGCTLYESLILCEFFEDTFPNTGPHILPTDSVDRAYARIWIDHLTKQFLPTFMRLVQSQDKTKQDEALEYMYEALRTFAKEIKGPYFLGEQFSLVDAAIAPWIIRDHIIGTHRGYERTTVSAMWARYAALVEQRPSVLNTTSVSYVPSVLSPNLTLCCRTGNITWGFTIATYGTRLRARLRRL